MPIRFYSDRQFRHPAHWPYVFAFLFTLLMVVFGYITVFIPWAMKDIAVGERAWAFPFKTCIQKTFSKENEETCLDNDWFSDRGVPLSGANETCNAFVLVVIAFVFLSVLQGLLFGLTLIWYMLENLWSHPIRLAYFLNVVLVLDCIYSYLAWVFFIIYMEYTCAPNSIFPISPGYSYGFIMYLFNSLFTTIAVACGIWGTRRLSQFKKQKKFLIDIPYDEDPNMYGYPVPPQAIYPMAVDTLPPVEMPTLVGTPSGAPLQFAFPPGTNPQMSYF